MNCVVCGAETPPVMRGNRISKTEHHRTCSAACRARRKSEVSIASNARRTSYPTGPEHPLWRGGRHKQPNGYIRLVRPPHPFPESITPGGWIYEHRAVMEVHLGRALNRREIVHHVNGDKSDNRIENLELVASQSEHAAEHATMGSYLRRWPACVFGCGRQSKSLNGRRFLACGHCRRAAATRNDPRAAMLE